MQRLIQILLGTAVVPLAYGSVVSLIGVCQGGAAAARFLAQSVVCGALAVGCLDWARRRAARNGALSSFSALDTLYSFYSLNHLRERPATIVSENPYVALSDAQLEDVVRNVGRSAPKERVAALLSVVKQRVELAFLPDGRPLPREVRTRAPTPAAPGSVCHLHAEHPASIVCPRCGAFCCSTCAEGRSYCRHCVDALLPPGG